VTLEVGIVLAVLGGGLVLFVTDLVRVDLAAILMVLVLILSGVLEPAEAFRGFGSSVLAFLAGLFIMSGGLVKTGVVERITLLLRASVRRRKERLGPACIATVAAVSAFVSNTVTVSIFVPVVNALSRRGGVKPSHLLMPIAYASMLGGVCTVIGTSKPK
jgi:Na+/H+ antiporter NhaD/arsenite permease-like protein